MNRNVITPWTTTEKLVEILEIGDLIEIRTRVTMGIPIYNHWAVYLGFQNSIHKVGHFANGGHYNETQKLLVNSFSGSICDEKEHRYELVICLMFVEKINVE